MIKSEPRRKPRKISNSAKTTMAALATLTLFGGWNLVGRIENGMVETAPNVAVQTAIQTSSSPTTSSLTTPWPTIKPLVQPAPIDTLVISSVTASGKVDKTDSAEPSPPGVVDDITLSPIPKLAPLATLEPLPPLPTLPEIPPPPAPTHAGTRTKAS